ncbi:uncharacterized protein BDZ99DRAFT_97185 [Mytilinidion resinicola]|uniref:Uncharacterized protein n=1 Tax=Mytilinidion resinicola TaxID=574789 RepID=A0A6A6YEV8_9PEZI|nr:uncharacterized protein BDZ99DRAFT_97185 [Mytilinidion resinicola]KAF2806544.1 hypothetical protein BDZ99DRAFT_97185 [Mytilinidion resinicola]
MPCRVNMTGARNPHHRHPVHWPTDTADRGWSLYKCERFCDWCPAGGRKGFDTSSALWRHVTMAHPTVPNLPGPTVEVRVFPEIIDCHPNSSWEPPPMPCPHPPVDVLGWPTREFPVNLTKYANTFWGAVGELAIENGEVMDILRDNEDKQAGYDDVLKVQLFLRTGKGMEKYEKRVQADGDKADLLGAMARVFWEVVWKCGHNFKKGYDLSEAAEKREKDGHETELQRVGAT